MEFTAVKSPPAVTEPKKRKNDIECGLMASIINKKRGKGESSVKKGVEISPKSGDEGHKPCAAGRDV